MASTKITSGGLRFAIFTINLILGLFDSAGWLGTLPQDRAPTLTDGATYDFIVVGAGSSGCLVANRLARNPKWRVLLVEAGGFAPLTSEVPVLTTSLLDTEIDWNYLTHPSNEYCAGMPAQRCRWPRGKATGGSSAINAMLYLRGNRKDYDQWAALGSTGWDYDSVLEHFKQFEHLDIADYGNRDDYGTDGELSLTNYVYDYPLRQILIEGLAEMGYERYDERNKPLGWLDSAMTVKNGRRHSSARAFLKPMDNLHLALNTHVNKVIIEEGSAQGVEVVINDVTLRLRTTKEVILSAGAINSPKILMLSGIGPRDHLAAHNIDVLQDLPVGRNLQDHIQTTLTQVVVPPALHLHFDHLGRLGEMYKFLASGGGAYATIGLTNFNAFVRTRNESYPSVQLLFIIVPLGEKDFIRSMGFNMGLPDYIIREELEIVRNSGLLRIAPTLLNPRSRGKVELSSPDPRDDPTIYPHYFAHEDDMRQMVEAVQFARSLVGTQPFLKHDLRMLDRYLTECPYPLETDAYVTCMLRHFAQTLYHPVGTCKMGAEWDADAVVDPQLRVYGVRGLRVIDASVMPTIVSANTNAACYVIAQKGASMIRDEWTDDEVDTKRGKDEL